MVPALRRLWSRLHRLWQKPAAATPPDAVPILPTLGPQYDSDQHLVYVEILLRALADNGPRAPKNIALTGHYGTGKSSVLAEVQRKLKRRAVSLTLASLGSPAGIDNGSRREPTRRRRPTASRRRSSSRSCTETRPLRPEGRASGESLGSIGCPK